MKAQIYNKDIDTSDNQIKLHNDLAHIESYNTPIQLGKNQAALYLNEVMYNATSAFKREKKILATIKAPSLYDIARKIIKGDSFIDITTTTDISNK